MVQHSIFAVVAIPGTAIVMVIKESDWIFYEIEATDETFNKQVADFPFPTAPVCAFKIKKLSCPGLVFLR